MNIKLFDSTNDARSYRYFVERTSRQICNFYDSSFWKGIVLQVGHVQPAIKYTIAALGSLHESSEASGSESLGGQACSAQALSLQQYGKAIHILICQAETVPVEVLLISSILFVCYETFQRNYGIAVNLLKCGFTILEQWLAADGTDCPSAKSNTAVDVIRNDIAPLFTRTRVQVSTFMELGMSNIRTNGPLAIPEFDMPDNFSCLGHARSCFDLITRALFNNPALVTKDYPDRLHVTDLIVLFQVELEKWYSKLMAFLSTNNVHSDPELRKGALFLQVHHRIACTIVPTIPYLDEILYDRHVGDFAAVVVLSSEFLESIHTGFKEQDVESSSTAEISLGFDLCIVPALFLTALRCRHPVVRRDALNLLYLRHRREGVWDSYTAARIATHVMIIEEKGLKKIRCCEDVPESNRIRLLHGKYQGKTADGPTPVSVPNLPAKGAEIHEDWCSSAEQFYMQITKLNTESKGTQSSNDPSRKALLRYVKSPFDNSSPVEEESISLQGPVPASIISPTS